MSKPISYDSKKNNEDLKTYIDEAFGFEVYDDEEPSEKKELEDLGDYNYFKYKESEE